MGQFILEYFHSPPPVNRHICCSHGQRSRRWPTLGRLSLPSAGGVSSPARGTADLLHRDGEAVALEDRTVAANEPPLDVKADAVDEWRAPRDLEVQGSGAAVRGGQRLL